MQTEDRLLRAFIDRAALARVRQRDDRLLRGVIDGAALARVRQRGDGLLGGVIDGTALTHWRKGDNRFIAAGGPPRRREKITKAHIDRPEIKLRILLSNSAVPFYVRRREIVCISPAHAYRS